MKNQTVFVPVNNHFYKDNNDYYDLMSNESSSQKIIKEWFKSTDFSKLTKSDLKNKKIFENVIIGKISRNDLDDGEDKIVYRINSSFRDNKEYYQIETGLYIGALNLNNTNLEIRTGYSKEFTMRMINVANDIYVNNSNINSGSNVSSIESLILEYMFITTLKKAVTSGFPEKYRKKNIENLNVRGEVNVDRLIKKFGLYYDGIPSIVSERRTVTEIVDVLYYAYQSLNPQIKKTYRKSLFGIERALKEHSSKKRPSSVTLTKALKNPVLNNPMYSKYKNALKWAELLLKKGNISDGDNSGITGYIIDVSELWEDYITSILKRNFTEWNVYTQEQLSLYSKQFYERNNYPDVVMRNKNTSEIVVLDAKFKRMFNKNFDVDRNDLHQIQSYAGYYCINNPNKLLYCSLVYPSVSDINDKNEVIGLYGLNTNSPKFSISYINISGTLEEIIYHEKEFCNRLKNIIEV